MSNDDAVRVIPNTLTIAGMDPSGVPVFWLISKQ